MLALEFLFRRQGVKRLSEEMTLKTRQGTRAKNKPVTKYILDNKVSYVLLSQNKESG